METYQLDNPNNARVIIDYTKKNKKVQFFYVGKDSRFKICAKFFIMKWASFPFFLLPLTILMPICFLLKAFSAGYIFFFLWIFIGLFVMFGIPLILALIFSKTKLIRFMPILQNFFQKHYLAEFVSKNVTDNKIEIPLFHNILLEYIAEHDFAKYLERVEVIEHPFNYVLRKKKRGRQYLWKATFYFSEQPKTGKLKIRFS